MRKVFNAAPVRRKLAKKKSPTRIDPTRLATLRRVWRTDLDRRFAKIRKAIIQLLLKDDAFGLNSKKVFNYDHDQPRNSKGQFVYRGTSSSLFDSESKYVHPTNIHPQVSSRPVAMFTDSLKEAQKFARLSVREHGGEPVIIKIAKSKAEHIGGPLYGIFKKTPVHNSFCPTGEGGGIDPTCSPKDNSKWNSNGAFAKQHIRAKNIVDKLVSHFNVPELNVLVDTQKPGKTVAEYSYADDKRGELAYIHIGPRADLETVVHEFAHHLDAQRGDAVAGVSYKTWEPPRSLAEVREVIAGAEHRNHSLMRASDMGWEKAAKGKGFIFNAFDPKDPIITHSANIENAERFHFQTSADQVNSFRGWLKRLFKQYILDEDRREEDQWFQQYVEEGFRKGAGRAFDDTRPAVKEWLSSEEANQPMGFYEGTRAEFLKSAFGRPVSVEKVKLLAGRTFTDLKGISDQMSAKLTRGLTDGLTMGQNSKTIAANLVKEVDVSLSRARAIAQTELTRCHAEGQLQAFRELGVVRLGVMAEWNTADDDRVCDECNALDDTVMTVDEATGLLPRHVQCRCAWLPANVGEDEDGQVRGKGKIEKAIDDSLEAEGGEDKTTWPGADVSISKERPEGIFNQTETENVFCATGEGGGVDPSCSPSHQLMTDSESLTALFGVVPGKGEKQAGITSSKIKTVTSPWDLQEDASRELAKSSGLNKQVVAAVLKACDFQPMMSSYAGSHVAESISRQTETPFLEEELLAVKSAKQLAKDSGGKRAANADYKVNGFSFHDRPLTDQQMDGLTRAIYNRTQKTLQDQGIKSLTVYRGVDKDNTSDWTVSHATIDKEVAEKFAKAKGGKVLSDHIPASRVFSIPTSGMGVHSQLEVLVLKSPMKERSTHNMNLQDKLRVIANYDPDQPRDSEGQWVASGDMMFDHEGDHEVEGVKYDSAGGLGQTGDNRNIKYMGHISYMTPGQFLRLNPERVQGGTQFIDEAVRERTPIGPPMLYGDYDEGNGTITVTGHEGRGRAMAIQKLNPQIQMPVHVILRKEGKRGSEGEMRSKVLTPEIAGSLILPDKRANKEASSSFEPHDIVIRGKQYQRD